MAAPAVSSTFTVVEKVAPCSIRISEYAAILILLEADCNYPLFSPIRHSIIIKKPPEGGLFTLLLVAPQLA